MAVRAVIAVCCLPQQAEKLLLDEDAPEEGAKPVTLFETVRLIFVSPQMRLSIPLPSSASIIAACVPWLEPLPLK